MFSFKITKVAQMVGAGAWVAGVREFEISRMICNKKLVRALQKKEEVKLVLYQVLVSLVEEFIIVNHFCIVGMCRGSSFSLVLPNNFVTHR